MTRYRAKRLIASAHGTFQAGETIPPAIPGAVVVGWQTSGLVEPLSHVAVGKGESLCWCEPTWVNGKAVHHNEDA